MADNPAGTNISAAVHAYQLAMSQQDTPASPSPALPSEITDGPIDPVKETTTHDTNAERPASPAPGSLSNVNAPSPLPPRTSTPVRMANGNEISSRAGSQHPDLGPTMPVEAPPHGAPTRQYLNSKVTGALLDGMKQLAKEQPRDPLRVLGEFLLQRSKETEGT